MSHFTVTVALPGTIAESDIEAELAKVLAPFDENLEVPRYVKYTREQLIEKGRQGIAEFRDAGYAKYLKDPVAYIEGSSNIAHLEYLAGGADALTNHPDPAVRAAFVRAIIKSADIDRSMPAALRDRAERTPLTYAESFPAKLEWTYEQVYAHEIQWVEEYNIGSEGEVYSEYNPQSQWDWYSIGGRWAGYWKAIEQAADTTELSHAAWADRSFLLGGADQQYVDERTGRAGRWVDVARKYDIDWEGTAAGDEHGIATFAFLDADGTWHEKGRMGWWGMVSNEKVQEDWNATYAKLLAATSDNAWLVLVDMHI